MHNRGQRGQEVNQIVAATRAARGGVQHLAVDGIVVLHGFEPLGGATSALGRAAQVEDEQGDGERDKHEARHPPRTRPGELPDHEAGPHQRRPFFQSSTRAQTATAIPPSASAMNSQRRVSR